MLAAHRDAGRGRGGYYRSVLEAERRGAHLPSKGPCLPFHMTASARGCWVPCTSPVSLTDRPDGEEAFGSLSW